MPVLPATYCDIGEIRESLPTATSVNTLGDQAIRMFAGDAQALIDTKLSKRYSTPFASGSVPPVIQGIAREITIYRLLTRRLWATMSQDEQSVAINAYKESEALLDSIAAGETPLQDGSGTLLTESVVHTQIRSSTDDYIPTAGDLDETYQRTDPDKTDDLLSERGIS